MNKRKLRDKPSPKKTIKKPSRKKTSKSRSPKDYYEVSYSSIVWGILTVIILAFVFLQFTSYKNYKQVLGKSTIEKSLIKK